MKAEIIPLGMDHWFKGDLAPVLDLISLADKMGIDTINLGEHILMGTDLSGYPYGAQNKNAKIFDERTPFFESLVYLGAVASVTKRARLSTGVMLSPLRTATLLAKQLATLDRLSGGRVEIGVGVGWQKLEYDAESIPWEGRFGRMTEIAQACKILWTQAPASFHGKHVNFDGVYSLPFPVQEGGIPQLFGVAPTERNIERMAQYADGWAALGQPLDVVAGVMTKIKRRMSELGRDPSTFRLRMTLAPVHVDGKPNIDASLATIPHFLDVGVTNIDALVMMFCRKAEDFVLFVEKFLAAKERYRRA